MSELQEYLDKNLKNVVFKDENFDAAKNLGKELIIARCQQKMTQKELADKTKIQQASISKIEHGLGNPNLQSLMKIANGLDKKLIIKFE